MKENPFVFTYSPSSVAVMEG